MTAPKALLITDGIYPMTIGGMQRHAYYLLLALVERGWQVEVYLPAYLNQDKFWEVFPKTWKGQVKLNPVEYPTFSMPLTYVLSERGYSKNLYKALEGRDDLSSFDAILTKGFTACTWKKESRKNFPPVISQLHGLEMFQPTFDFKSKMAAKSLQRIALDSLRNADWILCYGGKIRDLHHKLLGSDKNLINFHGGLLKDNLKDSIQPTGSTKKFLFIGRNERRKGIPELLQIANQAFGKKGDFELHWIGELDEGIRPTDAAFHYHGKVTSLTQYFNIVDTCDCLLLPSISEGFPTVLPESMGRGLTALAMDVGAVNQLVNDHTGWLVPDHQEFEKQFNLLIQEDPKELDRRKQGALDQVKESFTWEYLGNRLIEVLNSASV
ncbi:glycosyltransferase family 4 protein [bacterium SCSIO 12741]|nr:glycosyltransferase family 4 protein [bacterium SCSIO 12741]